MIISDANILSSFAAAKGLLLLFDILHEDVIYVLPPSFGLGEKEAVALCLREKASLLSNEKRVVNYCLRNDIPCLNLKALLRLLWKDGLMSKAKVKTMMVRMTKVEGIVFKTTEEIFAD